jgi:hypothetical protein
MVENNSGGMAAFSLGMNSQGGQVAAFIPKVAKDSHDRSISVRLRKAPQRTPVSSWECVANSPFSIGLGLFKLNGYRKHAFARCLLETTRIPHAGPLRLAADDLSCGRLIGFRRPLGKRLAPASRSLADDPLEHGRKMRLRAEACYGGHIGYRHLRIEKQLL